MTAFNGLLINRLIVLLQVILIPIYFIIYTINWHNRIIEFMIDFFNSSYSIWFIPISFQWMNLPEAFIRVLVIFGIPIFYSLPWVVISIIRATKIANTYELMGRALGKVRIDQKIFYGLNAAFAFIFLVFPIFSPIITVIGIFIAVRLFMRKILIGKIGFLFWFIPALFFAFFPILIAFAFYLEYTALWSDVYAIWWNYIEIIFGIGLCLAIAIAFGNFVLLNQEGAVQYGSRTSVNYELVLGLKILTFIIFLFIFFIDPSRNIIYFINIAALFIGLITILIRYLKKVELEGGGGFGFIMIPIFSIVNFIQNQFSKGFVILAAAFIFVGLFAISYRYSSDEELFQ
jgi:hypothetical protein